jgi:chorismate synthase
MRIIYSGESHMDGVMAVIEGFPAGFEFDEERMNRDLARRQAGYGRGARMQIEEDRVRVISGVIRGMTIGSPITLMIPNKDNRRDTWDPARKQTIPRPGHADMAGALKYGFDDIRLVAERASARQTASWVAAGSLLVQFLEKVGMRFLGFVDSLGGIEARCAQDPFTCREVIEKSPIRVAEAGVQEQMKMLIDKARDEGETLGGTITVIVRGVPPGLGTYAHPDKRLDSMLAAAFVGIPSVKAVEFGDGFRLASIPGSQSCDVIKAGERGFHRVTNHAGGIEGGISNGEDVVIRAVSKPIPTLRSPLRSVDIQTRQEVDSPYIRSDVCVVPSVSVIGEMVAAIVIAGAFLEKFGGDTFDETIKRYRHFKKLMEENFRPS